MLLGTRGTCSHQLPNRHGGESQSARHCPRVGGRVCGTYVLLSDPLSEPWSVPVRTLAMGDQCLNLPRSAGTQGEPSNGTQKPNSQSFHLLSGPMLGALFPDVCAAPAVVSFKETRCEHVAHSSSQKYSFKCTLLFCKGKGSHWITPTALAFCEDRRVVFSVGQVLAKRAHTVQGHKKC